MLSLLHAACLKLLVFLLMFYLFQPTLFYHRVWQKSHILNVLNMHFTQVMFCYLPLGSKNSTFHSVFKHPHTLSIHLTLNLPIPYSYKAVGKYIHIISVYSVKTSVNFPQMQWNFKNPIGKQNCKLKSPWFFIITPVCFRKEITSYIPYQKNICSALGPLLFHKSYS